jgi:hypothetical protein
LFGTRAGGAPPGADARVLIDVDKMSKSATRSCREVIMRAAGILRLRVAMSDSARSCVGKQILARDRGARVPATRGLSRVESVHPDPARDRGPWIARRTSSYIHAVGWRRPGCRYGSLRTTRRSSRSNQFLTAERGVLRRRLRTGSLAASPERRSAHGHGRGYGLARLLAPIPPVTADELWKHSSGAAE